MDCKIFASKESGSWAFDGEGGAVCVGWVGWCGSRLFFDVGCGLLVKGPRLAKPPRGRSVTSFVSTAGWCPWPLVSSVVLDGRYVEMGWAGFRSLFFETRYTAATFGGNFAGPGWIHGLEGTLSF